MSFTQLNPFDISTAFILPTISPLRKQSTIVTDVSIVCFISLVPLPPEPTAKPKATPRIPETIAVR